MPHGPSVVPMQRDVCHANRATGRIDILGGYHDELREAGPLCLFGRNLSSLGRDDSGAYPYQMPAYDKLGDEEAGDNGESESERSAGLHV
jgi:hypothetical protein